MRESEGIWRRDGVKWDGEGRGPGKARSALFYNNAQRERLRRLRLREPCVRL